MLQGAPRGAPGPSAGEGLPAGRLLQPGGHMGVQGGGGSVLGGGSLAEVEESDPEDFLHLGKGPAR